MSKQSSNSKNKQPGGAKKKNAGNNKNKQAGKASNSSRNAWIGGAIALSAGVAAAIGLVRSGWQPFKGQKDGSSGSGNASARATAPTGGAGKVDVELNEEVASAIESTPKSQKNFTDEGATGNND